MQIDWNAFASLLGQASDGVVAQQIKAATGRHVGAHSVASARRKRGIAAWIASHPRSLEAFKNKRLVRAALAKAAVTHEFDEIEFVALGALIS
jgi:hypothetical protein